MWEAESSVSGAGRRKEEEEEEGGGFIALHLRGICCAHHLPVGKTGVLTQTVRASL